MKRSSIVVALLVLGATAASAQNLEAIKARQTLYKAMAAVTKAPAGALKGAAPFDLEAARTALDTYIATAAKLPGLFPEDSKTGGETQALPEVWTHKDEFLARLAKFGQDATAAKASIKDEASFKAQFPKVLANCGGCHKVFRAKDQ